jgi:chromosome segregation ATPase
MDDNAKEALATAKAYEDGLMGGIQGVLNAFEQLESIQQRVGRAEQQRDKAVKAQTQAEQQLESALDQQTQARHRSKVATEESKKVSAEEELAILRQEQVVLDLAKAQDGSREKQLELQLATKELNKIRDDAIKMDSEAIKQHRLLMQSNDLVAKAEQKVKDAKQEVIDTQAKLNELTEASAKNILEQALAQEQLTRALSNFGEGTKGYEDAMKKISDITGESLDFVMKKFSDVFTEANNLSNLGADLRSTSTSSTTTNSSSTSNNGSPSVPPVSQTQFPTTTQPLTEERRADIFSRLGETNINIYQSGTIIGNDDEFVRQTAKAFEKAKKQGVVFS